MEDKFEKSEVGSDEAKTTNPVDQNTGPVLNKDVLREYIGIQEKEKSSNFKDRLDFYLEQFKENIANNVTIQELKYFWTPIRMGVVAGAVLLVFVVFYLFALVDVNNSKLVSQYRLVPEKISKSAAIRISIPDDIDVEKAKNSVVFNPRIDGSWVDKKYSIFDYVFAGDGKKMLFFKPNNQLVEDRYYQASLDMGDGKKIKADFLAVDDPKVEAVFPGNTEEAMEDSKIIIAFNRPMISFDSESVQDVQNPPIEIIPETRGKFRWISPNVLQFQPEENLISSMNYNVKVKEGFVSLDDIKVPGGDFSFKTRTLKYLGDNKNDRAIVYNQPIRIYFNQQVDIKKIASEISIYGNGHKIPFYIGYADKSGSAEVKNDSQPDIISSIVDTVSSSINNMGNGVDYFVSGDYFVDTNESNKDLNVIEIYNKNDKNNNDRIWDLDVNYSMIVNKVYPVKGDIALEEKREINFSILSIIKDINAYSQRTTYSSLDSFDPQGYVSIDFYEDVDLNKSRIESSSGIEKTEYGEKCLDDNMSNSSCLKTVNKKELRIHFNEKQLADKTKTNLVIKEVVGESGRKINSSDISYEIKTYRPLDIKIGKDKNKSNFSALILCSNNPLEVPNKEDFKKVINADGDYEIFSWGVSWQNNYYDDNYCPKGDFVTTVDVGFIPEKNYSLGFLLNDVFGQSVEQSLGIVTDKATNEDISIFSMQKDYNITSSKKTSVSFGVKNIDYADIEICKKYDAASFYDSYIKRDSLMSNCENSKKDKVQLPLKRWVNNYFDIDIKKYFDEPLGNYVVKISHPNFKNKDGGNEIYSFITITNIAVSEKRVDLTDSKAEENGDIFGEVKNIYWITNVETQEPIEGAKVKIYASGKIIEGLSNKEGLAFITPVSNFDEIVVEYGRDSTVISKDDYLSDPTKAYAVKKAYIYTDKPVYKMEETVNIRGLFRLGYDGIYKIPTNEVQLEISNPKGEKISNATIALGEFGTFTSYFKVEKDAPLGDYSICATDYGCSHFNVQENIPSAFEVNVIPTKDEFVSKEVIKLNLSANYQFGVPVENAEVEYTISAQDFYFDRAKEVGVSFESDDGEDDGEIIFAKGKTILDIYGKGEVSEIVDIEKVFKNSSRSKVLYFDFNVKSSFGQRVSYRKQIILHQGDFYLGASVNPYFLKVNKNLIFKIMTADGYGKPKAVKDMVTNIYRVSWEHEKNKNPDGTYSYSWKKKRDFVKSGKISTDRNGTFSRSGDSIAVEGEYEIDFSGSDTYGNKISLTKLFYVFGEKQVEVRSNDGLNLDLEVINPNINLSEKGHLIIKSPYPKAKALVTVERGRVFEHKVIDIVGGLYDFEFTPKGEYFPNVYVSVLLQGPDSAIRFGSKEFFIKSGLSNLNISVTTNKANYLPGEEVLVKIRTLDGNRSPTPSEVSLSVFSNDLLKSEVNINKDPFSYFYTEFPLTVSAYSNMKNVIGGDMIKMKGNSSSGDEVLAKKFRDVIYWNGEIQTNTDGYKEITLKLPQALGNWRIEAIGVNKGSNVGIGYADFVSRKELMITPLRPSFIIPGDKFYVGAEIVNQTDTKKTVNASFASDTLNFLGGNKETLLNIEPGDSQTVYFFVEAPFIYLRGQHSFIVNTDIQDSDTLVPCTAEKDESSVRGKCGSVNGQKLSSKPENDLCKVGTPSQVSGEGPWSWTCEGFNGGKATTCKSLKVESSFDGRCGKVSGKKTAFAPDQDLCSVGKASEVLGFGLWTWTCEGFGGGKSASCSAPRDESVIDGECGRADKKFSPDTPVDYLCDYGKPSPVSIFWTWTCEGANGGISADCSAKKSDDSKNKCGSADKKKFFSSPTENLCLVGTPSKVTGEGPWAWTCGDTHSSVEEKIDVRENNTYDYVYIGGGTNENEVDEVIYVPDGISTDKGELSIRTSPNISVFLSDSLNYLVNYPYISSEQLASKLKSMILSGQGLGITSIFEKFKLESSNRDPKYGLNEEIEQSLKKLYNNQNYDGGFSLWGAKSSDYNKSVAILDSLIVLNNADKIKDDDKKFLSLIDYVYNNSFNGDTSQISADRSISSAYVLLSSGKYKNDKKIKDSLEKILKDDVLLKEKISNQTLAKLAIIANGGGFSWGMDDKVNKLLESRLVSDSKGVFIEPKKDNTLYDNYETSINDTALYLKSLAVGKKDKGNNEKIIQWLVNSKSRDGSWGSTKDTAEVIDAFVSYLNWKRFNDSNYELSVIFNGEKVDSLNFGAGSTMDQTSKRIEISKMKHKDYNVISFDKSKHRPLFKDNLYYDILFKQYISAEAKPEDSGLSITRGFYSLNDSKNDNPMTSISMGNILKVHLQIVVPKESRSIIVEDHIPAGMEVVDIDLATEKNYSKNIEKGVRNDYFYPDHGEIKSDRVFLYKDNVSPGVYYFDYYVIAKTKGVYSYLSSIVSEAYNPRVFGRTGGSHFEIK
ncbi:MAG: MG2 domain-containing protein [Candidatus Pacebacteria bacterium]|nr:MG2 domain-containing protein [Candidatus Paceibacterota bacterium]